MISSKTHDRYDSSEPLACCQYMNNATNLVAEDANRSVIVRTPSMFLVSLIVLPLRYEAYAWFLRRMW